MKKYTKTQSSSSYESLPRTHDWSEAGGIDRIVAGQPVVGHETPSDFAARMDERAEKDGAAGLDDRETIAEDAPPIKEARESANIRIGVAKKAMAATVTGLRRTVAEAPERAQKALSEAVFHENRFKALGAKLDKLREVLPPLKARRDQIKQKIGELPLYRHAMKHLWPVLLSLGAVGGFDGAVTKSALNQTAFDPLSIWMTTIGVALVFMVLAEAFGYLVALVVRKVGARRPALYALGLFIGLFGAFLSIAMLGWFRHEAAVQQNQSLNEIAAGHHASVTFFIDPSFLAPLQGVGCVAAMVVVALYVLAGDWRQLRSELGEAEAEIQTAKDEIVQAERQREAARQEGQAAALRTFDIRAEAEGAEAEIPGHELKLVATEEAERANGNAMANRYKGERNYVKGIYDNGNVRRCAMPTKFGLRRAYTPAPCDVDAGDQVPAASSNGHKEGALDPDQMSFDWREG